MPCSPDLKKEKKKINFESVLKMWIPVTGLNKCPCEGSDSHKSSAPKQLPLLKWLGAWASDAFTLALSSHPKAISKPLWSQWGEDLRGQAWSERQLQLGKDTSQRDTSLRKVLNVEYAEWDWRGRPVQPGASDTGKHTQNTIGESKTLKEEAVKQRKFNKLNISLL